MPTVSGIAHVRKVMHSLLSPGLVIVSFCLVAFFWFRSLTIEPFDSFESIHRVLASEMKLSVQSPMDASSIVNIEPHSSALYSSFLTALSGILDGDGVEVSALTGRVFSVFLSLLILWTLHSTWKSLVVQKQHRTFEERRVFTSSLSPVFYVLLNAPILGASVLFSSDLLFLAVASIYLCRQTVIVFALFENRKATLWNHVLVALALSGTLAVSGWRGFLSLTFCSSLFLVFNRRFSHSNTESFELRTAEGRFVKLLLVQSIFGLLLFFTFAFLYRDRPPFELVDFRNSTVFEPFAFQALKGALSQGALLFLCAAICFSYSLALLIYSHCIDSSGATALNDSVSIEPHFQLNAQGERQQTLWFCSLLCGWLLCFFTLDSFISALLFGCPVLSLWAVLLRGRRSFSLFSRFRKYTVTVSHGLTFLVPAILFSAGSVFLIHSQFLLDFLPLFKDTRLGSFFSIFTERSAYIGTSFFAAGVFSFIASFILFLWASACLRRKRRSQLFLSGAVRLIVLMQSAVAVVVLQCVVAEAEDVLTSSLQQAVNKAKLYLEPKEPLATVGFFAPNVFSYFGGVVAMRKDAADDLFQSRKYSVILTPDWNIGLCEKHGYDIAAGAEFYKLCLRSYKKALEGPQN